MSHRLPSPAPVARCSRMYAHLSCGLVGKLDGGVAIVDSSYPRKRTSAIQIPDLSTGSKVVSRPQRGWAAKRCSGREGSRADRGDLHNAGAHGADPRSRGHWPSVWAWPGGDTDVCSRALRKPRHRFIGRASADSSLFQAIPIGLTKPHS